MSYFGQTGRGHKNFVKNGTMDFWQRNTTHAPSVHGSLSADQWHTGEVGDSVVTISRDTDVPTLAQSGYQSAYSMKVDVTTADASVAAGDIRTVHHRIEGFDWAEIAGKDFTVSFWVKSPKTGVHGVCIANTGIDRVWPGEYTIAVADTWEKHSITVDASPAGGTWDKTIGIGIYILFPLYAGTDFHETSGTAQWNSDALYVPRNQVNCMDNIANNWFLTQVKVEEGRTATPFVRAGKSYEAELSLLQRYYEKSYEIATPPGTATAVGVAGTLLTALASGAHRSASYVYFATAKRAVPTISIYSNSTGTVAKMYDAVNTVDVAATSNITGTHSTRIDCTMSVANTALDVSGQWVAESIIT